MNRFRFGKFVRILAFAVVAIAGFGLVVMSLWNWVVPPLTGWHAIGLAQAIALLVLCRILFGGFRGPGGGPWHRGMRESFAALTPEERERLRPGGGHPCRSRAAPPEAGA